jgi:quercetin dioxygenase-like cupin family protein
MYRRFFLGGLALAAAFTAGVMFSKLVVAQGPSPVPGVREVLRDTLNGMEGQEVIMQEATLPAGAVIPWHIHPDGHEITFVLEGSPTLEVEGQGVKKLNAGEGFHIQPGVVHRGMNESGAPAKVLFVRLKPKDKPIMVPVQR